MLLHDLSHKNARINHYLKDDFSFDECEMKNSSSPQVLKAMFFPKLSYLEIRVCEKKLIALCLQAGNSWEPLV